MIVYLKENKSLWYVAWTHRVQTAAGRGLSERAKLADVKVY